MDFVSREAHPTPSQAPAASTSSSSKKAKRSWRGLRALSVVLLVSVGILILALSTSLALGNVHNEEHYLNTKEYQAVFLNGGQVYFGHITRLNTSFVRLADIYYLRVNQTVQPNGQTTNQDVSLVKLGCELHGPADEMLINRDQVIFWENLKDSGQVGKAIATYKQQNPNGQQCAQPSQNNSNTNSNTNSNSTNKSQ